MSNTPFYFIISLCVALCIGSPALADNKNNVRQKLFGMDKAVALAHFDTAQKQACIKALDARYQSRYALIGDLAFNERLSLEAYDSLFWKGEGDLRRGLLFTGYVADRSGAKAGNVICYYAMTDDRLDFQSAYVLPIPNRETVIASQAQGSIGTPSLTSLGKE